MESIRTRGFVPVSCGPNGSCGGYDEQVPVRDQRAVTRRAWTTRDKEASS